MGKISPIFWGVILNMPRLWKYWYLGFALSHDIIYCPSFRSINSMASPTNNSIIISKTRISISRLVATNWGYKTAKKYGLSLKRPVQISWVILNTCSFCARDLKIFNTIFLAILNEKNVHLAKFSQSSNHNTELLLWTFSFPQNHSELPHPTVILWPKIFPSSFHFLSSMLYECNWWQLTKLVPKSFITYKTGSN